MGPGGIVQEAPLTYCTQAGGVFPTLLVLMLSSVDMVRLKLAQSVSIKGSNA